MDAEKLVYEEIIIQPHRGATQIRIPRKWLRRWYLKSGEFIVAYWHPLGRIIYLPESEFKKHENTWRGYRSYWLIPQIRTLYIPVPDDWLAIRLSPEKTRPHEDKLVLAESNISYYLILEPKPKEDR